MSQPKKARMPHGARVQGLPGPPQRDRIGGPGAEARTGIPCPEDPLKLRIAHTFPCTPEQFWESYWDEALDAELQQRSTMRRELLSERHEGTVRIRHQKFFSSVELPAPVVAALGMKQLTYEQITQIDQASHKLSWRVIPPVYKDKVKAEGTMVVRAVEGGTERVIEGDVSVPIAFFGKTIEQKIVESLEKAEEIGSVLRTRWLKARYA